MSTTTSPPAQPRPLPASGPDGVVVLRFATTAAERGVLDDWLGREGGAADAAVELVDADDTGLASRLERQGDRAQVLPVRVAWLPPERAGGERGASLGDLLTLSDPRRPRAAAQTRILQREPERVRVITGEPATVEALRTRYVDRTNGVAGEEFGSFVRRQAILALERAERPLVGERYKVPRLVRDEITASARFRERIARIAEQQERVEAEVLEEASGYLREMAASSSRLAIDAWEQLVRVALTSRTIDVDRARLEELRTLGRRRALVFLPSHRSYVDPLVLRTVLHANGFPPNQVLGGVNVAFWPIGPLARRSGYVFIRRSIRDNPVYKLTLREYIGYLVRKRFNLEWYMEGGRTRTGKLRTPKLGLLAYLVEAVLEGAAEDVWLVPTSIVYEHLPELSAMAEEGVGGAKKREGIGWFVRYLREQSATSSTVHLRFGDPLSLREGLAAARDDGAGSHAVEKLAFEVSHRINRSTPVTATALVTLALLGAEDRALTLDEVRTTLAPLVDYVRRRGLPAIDGATLGEARSLRRALEALQRQGLVGRFADGPEVVWGIAPGRHLEAAFHRNSVAHFLLNRAVVELIAARGIETPFEDPVEDAWQEALRLRDLLKFEFFLPRRARFAEELRDEVRLLDPDWERHAGDPAAILERLAASGPLVAHRILRAYFEAYLVVAERLAARDPRVPVEERAFLRECLGTARQLRLQQRLLSPEAVSTELFSTGLALAANRDLVDPGREEIAEGRRMLAEELRGVVRRLGAIRDLDARGCGR